MAMAGLSKLFQRLERTLLADRSDGQLLGEFLATRNEAAFTALVQRHGRMVLGVCRRVLRHTQDAEDAFQATFLVLACKAGAVLRRESLGSWLYGVAYRTAQEARSRRRYREKQVEQMPQPLVLPVEPQDWRSVLDEELSRLPEKYRAALILCELEGLSRKEAAGRLGLPEGTLSSRLATGRRILGERLGRRGLALSVGGVPAMLAEANQSGPLSPVLTESTATAAALVAGGEFSAVGPATVALTQGVLGAMVLAKVKVALGTLFVFLVFAAAGVAYQAGSGPAGGKDKGRPLTEVEALRRENELLRVNLEVLLEKVQAQEAQLRALRGQAKSDASVVDALTRTRLGERVADKKPVADPEAARTAEGVTRLAEELLRHNREAVEAERRLAEEQAIRQAQAEADLAAARAAAQLEAQERARRAEEEARKAAKRAEDTASLEQQVKKVLQDFEKARTKEEKDRAIDTLEKLLRKLHEREGGPLRIYSPRLSPGQDPEKKS
jgi:RNA polymerase sigma factor (sigma-70 family)